VKAYSYLRWSSAPQTDGDSLTRQLHVTRNICKEKGWELDETFKPDAGISGYSGENLTKGSLAAFLAAVEQHRIETPCVLVVEALDRLTRTRLRDARKLFEGLLEKGVQICTANNNKLYDDSSLDNPMDLFMSLMELNAAHLYAKEISRRVRGAWTRKKEAATRGIILTSKTPGWIKADRKANTTVLLPDKAAVVKRIFNSYLDGKGPRTIMRELNRDKIPSFGNGGAWNTTHIDRLLRSPTVLGEYQPKKHFSKTEHQLDGVPIPNYYPAAIDKALFYKVQQAIKDRACPIGRKSKAHNLLTALATCSKCGKHLTYMSMSKPDTGKRYSWLVCDSRARATGCTSQNIQYPIVEKAILTVLSIYIVLNLGGRRSSDTTLKDLQAELTHSNETLNTLKLLLNDPTLVSKTTLQVIRDLELKADTLKQRIESTPASNTNPFSNWTPLPNTPDNRIKLRMILGMAIESLVVDGASKSATLKLKKLPVCLQLQWKSSPRVRRDDRRFEPRVLDSLYINGKPQPYLDNVVIWESPENVKDTCTLMDIVLKTAISTITMNAVIAKPPNGSTEAQLPVAVN